MVGGNDRIKHACEAAAAGGAAVKRRRRQYLAERAGKPLPNALTPEQREIQPLKQRIQPLETEREPQKKPAPSFAPTDEISGDLVGRLKAAHPLSQVCGVLGEPA